ncbi:MAG: GMP synthase [Candidatus Aenigmatarchaeota archaeon]|nr:MAG: GMP synthase [Candidatus Aenigmarchaeota archaeon]
MTSLIGVVDNGSRYIRQILNFLEKRGVEFCVYPPYPKVLKSIKNGHSALILTGSPWRWEVYSQFLDAEMELVRESKVPVLGICFGHQVISRAFGVGLFNLGEKVEGEREMRVVKKDPIFDGLDRSFKAFESHKWGVERVPPGFSLLASSDHCRVEAIKHRRRPIYGVQFHPEMGWDGELVLENFLKVHDII